MMSSSAMRVLAAMICFCSCVFSPVDGSSRVERDVNALYPVYPTSFLKRDGASHAHNSNSPSGSYQSPDDSYAQPSPGYAAPSNSYSAPSPSYSSPSYTAPSPSYNEPSDGYAAGDSSYQAPAAAYGGGAPSYAAENEGFGIDLISLIIPALAILGLSLLFPTVVSLSTRRKRSVEDLELSGDVKNIIMDRLGDMYLSMGEAEACIERLACNLGAIIQEYGYDTEMLGYSTPFLPAKYHNLMRSFSKPNNCLEIKCKTQF